MSVSVEADGGDNDHPRDIEADVNGMTLEDDGNDLDNMDDQATGTENQYRKEDLESRLNGDSPRSSDSQESLTREEKLLEEMLRLKLVGSGSGGTSNSMLPPKQRIKLYQPRTKMEQFEDILLESQLLDQNLPDFGGAPLDYEKFDLESLSLQEALNGFTDYESTDAIFAEDDNQDTRESSEDVSGSCECDSCFERSALVTEMAEETKKLQQCWLQLRDDFKCVYKLVQEEAWSDSNRPHPSLSEMQEAVHKLVWRDPHQLYQRLESQLKDIVVDMKQKLVELLSKQAKNPSLAQDFIQTLLSCHEKLCEASKILGPVLSDLEVNHLRRFSLTWELLSKHMYQTLVYCDPLIQNNLPIFISQLRALYPNKENEDKYTELVRGYLDFDVDMENIGVFWSGAEALILDYSRDQQKLRDKQKMLKSDWEKFKSQRKQIENSLREKAETNGGGEEVLEDEFEINDDDLQQQEGGVCECHACDEPVSDPPQEPLFPPLTTTPVTSGSVYPHLYNLPNFSSSSPGSVTTTVTSSLVSSVASLSAALSSTLTLTSSSAPSVSSAAASATTTTPKSATPAVAKAATIQAGPAPTTTSPKRPTSLPVAAAQPTVAEADKKAAPAKPQVPLDKRPTTCSHRHNNKNAKELKKMMEKDQKRKEGPKKSKSSSACHDHDHGDDCESTDEMSEDSDPEDSCSGSSTGNDKNCACCYCEVFGHGNPSGAPVPSNYPQMRERLRLLLSKKKRSNRAAQAANQPKAPAQQVQQKQQQPSVLQQKPAQQANQQQQVQQQQAKTVTIKRQAAAPATQQPQVQAKPAVAPVQDSFAKKDVDEIIDFIEGTGSASEKKRLKKERQKQQKFEVLRAKQEEERRRKAAEEAARKAIEEQERLRKEAEEKALKKSKKKAAQKAKKLAANGDPVTPLTPTTPLAPSTTSGGQPNKAEAMMDLENMQLEHIRQQKELLERQKRQLEEQQRKLDEELNRKIAEKNAAQAAAVAAEKAKDAANSQLSKKQAKKQAKKAAAASLAHSASSSSVNSASSVTAPSNSFGASPAYPQASYPPYQPQPPGPPNYANPFQAAPPMASPYSMPGMYPGMGGPYQPPGAGYPQQAGGFSPFGAPPFQAAPPAPQPAKTPASSAKEAKSDQPMVTIKRVMRPDTDEPTVTISVKKDDPKAPGKVEKQKEQVLFTLVNGQVLKTPSAPDNLIPSAVPMPKDLQQKILPEEEKLSKKQRKKLNKAQAEAASGDSRPQQPGPAASRPAANLPTTAQGNVDLDRLRLPDGVSISKISGPVPERKYFPVKSGPEPGPQIVQSNPWSNNGAQIYGGQPQMASGPFGNMYGAQPMQGQGINDNVIVVDPNSNDEKGKGKKKKNKNKDNSSNNIPSPMVQQPPVQPQMWGQQPQMPGGPAPGMFGGMRPSNPMASQPQMTQQPPASTTSKSKEWTPAQYGGYVPPSDGKGGGQVLIKSVNGKVVITPIPGTGDNPPVSANGTAPATTNTATAVKKSTPVPSKVSTPAPAPAPVKKQVPAQVPATNKAVTNGTGPAPAVNGNPVISNGNNNNDSTKENNAGLVNGNNKEEAIKKMKKHKSPELDDYNSIFDPRNMDCGGVDAADREIEQFKLFCRDSVPVQNRTKVSFDVRNIAFKKKL